MHLIKLDFVESKSNWYQTFRDLYPDMEAHLENYETTKIIPNPDVAAWNTTYTPPQKVLGHCYGRYCDIF